MVNSDSANLSPHAELSEVRRFLFLPSNIMTGTTDVDSLARVPRILPEILPDLDRPVGILGRVRHPNGVDNNTQVMLPVYS